MRGSSGVSYGGGYQANISNSSGILCLVCVGQGYPREPRLASLQHVVGQWSWLGLWLWWLVRWTAKFERQPHLWGDTGHQCLLTLVCRTVSQYEGGPIGEPRRDHLIQ